MTGRHKLILPDGDLNGGGRRRCLMPRPSCRERVNAKSGGPLSKEASTGLGDEGDVLGARRKCRELACEGHVLGRGRIDGYLEYRLAVRRVVRPDGSDGCERSQEESMACILGERAEWIGPSDPALRPGKEVGVLDQLVGPQLAEIAGKLLDERTSPGGRLVLTAEPDLAPPP